MYLFLSSPKDTFFFHRFRERKGEDERERGREKRETLIGCLLVYVFTGIEPATWICYLTGNQTLWRFRSGNYSPTTWTTPARMEGETLAESQFLPDFLPKSFLFVLFLQSFLKPWPYLSHMELLHSVCVGSLMWLPFIWELSDLSFNHLVLPLF